MILRNLPNHPRVFGLPKQREQPMSFQALQPATVAMRTAPTSAPTTVQPATSAAGAIVKPAAPQAQIDPMTQYLGRDFRSLGLDPMKAVKGFADGGVVDGAWDALKRHQEGVSTIPGAQGFTRKGPAQAKTSAIIPPTVTETQGTTVETVQQPIVSASNPYLSQTQSQGPPSREIEGMREPADRGGNTFAGSRSSLPASADVFRPPEFIVQEGVPTPTLPTTVDGIDALRPNEAWVLEDGTVVGLGGKLDRDVDRAVRREYGRDAREDERTGWRSNLLGGMTIEQLMAGMNASQEGQDYNLARDPLDDLMFTRRLYRAILGTEPDEQGREWFMRRLAQGVDRRALLNHLLAYRRSAPQFRGQPDPSQADLDAILDQGDAFESELQDDDLEREVARGFRRIMGRDPSDYELARYASMMRGGAMPMTAQQLNTALMNLEAGHSPETVNNPFINMLRARKTEGFNRGGRVRARKLGLPKRAPLTIEGYADGGRTFANDPDGRNRRGEAYYAQLLGDRNPFGSVGQVGLDNLEEEQWRALPEFIRRQYYAGEDEGGRRVYRLQNSVLRNEDGSEFVQVGDMSSAVGEGDNSVLDWDQVRYDPQLGLITSAGNRRSVTSDAHRNGRLITALTMAALGGYTALEGGLLSGAEGAASYPGYIDAIGNAAEGAVAGAPTTGALAGGAGGISGAIDPALLAPLEGATPTGAGTALTGTPGIAGAGEGAAGAFEGASAGGHYGSGSLTDRLLQWARANPQQAARLGMGVYSLFSGGDGGGDTGQRGSGRRYTRGAGLGGGGYTIGAGGTMNYQPRGYAKGGRVAQSGIMKDARMLAGGEVVGRDDPRFGDPVIAELMQTAEGRALLEEFARETGTPLPREIEGMLEESARGDIFAGERTALGKPTNFNPWAASARTADIGTGGERPPTGAGGEDLSSMLKGGSPGIYETGGGRLPIGGGGGDVFSGDQSWRRQDDPIGGGGERGPGAVFGRGPDSMIDDRRAPGDVGPGRGGDRPPTGTGGDRPAIYGRGPDSMAPVVATDARDVMQTPTSRDSGPTSGPGVTFQSAATNTSLGSDDPINTLLGLSREQINRYRRFDPLERQVIDEAGRAGSDALQNERAALAGEDVAGQFDRERGMMRRNLQRGGINPYSMQAAALTKQLGVSEAGAKAAAMNEARRAERDSGFGRRMAALGLGDSALKTGLGALSGGIGSLLDRERTAAQQQMAANQVAATMAGISAREREAAAAREQQGRQFDVTFGEGRRRWDSEFGEGQFRDRRDFGENTRRFDRTFDEGQFRDRRNFGRDVYRDDRDFDFSVWRTNEGFEDRDDERDYRRRRDRWQDIGSGIRTGVDIWSSLSPYLGYADGGRAATRGLPAYVHGDRVEAPGDGTVDTQLAKLAAGEGVINAEGMEYLDKVAPGTFEKVNKIGQQIRAMRNGGRAATRGLGS